MPDARSTAAAHQQDFLPLSAAGAGREGSWRREKERGRRWGGGAGKARGRGEARGRAAGAGPEAGEVPQARLSPAPPGSERTRARRNCRATPWLPPPPLCALLSPCPAPGRTRPALWRVRRTFRLQQLLEAGWERGWGPGLGRGSGAEA